MVDPYVVEKWVARPRFNPGLYWIPVLDVPKATIRDARAWLKAQGYGWTTTQRWRIVDREGKVIREFTPRGF